MYAKCMQISLIIVNIILHQQKVIYNENANPNIEINLNMLMKKKKFVCDVY